jgi:hypothetical protein
MLSWDRQDRTIVGAKPLSWTKRTALETVRNGLSDVLKWLGEPVETPMHHEIMHAVHEGYGPGMATLYRAWANPVTA